MENNESLGTGLLVLVCAAGSALIGAIGGAIAMTTEKGRKIDSNLGCAYDKVKTKVPEGSSLFDSSKLLKK